MHDILISIDSKIKAFTPLLSNTTQNIVNQKSHSPRRSNITNLYDSYIQSIIKPLFGRCADLPDLVLHMLLYYDLQSILTLRLVAKGLYYVISVITPTCACTPLTNKSCISFQHNQLYPVIDLKTQEKFDFAKQNTTINITLSISDLLNPSLILTSIAEDRLEIILKIDNLNELKQLQAFLSNQSEGKSINRIKGLDFSKLIISLKNLDCINELLNTISQKLDFSLKLKTLILGSITGVYLELPNTLINLSTLFVGLIVDGATLKLSDAFKNLTTFTVRMIRSNATIILPPSLNNLKTLYIGTMEYNARLELPDLLDNLKTLTIGTIRSDATLRLPASLNNLATLTIGGVGDDCSEKKYNSLNNLPTQDVKSIYLHSGSELFHSFSFDNLTALTIAVSAYVDLNLNKHLTNLIKLTINDVSIHSTLHLYERNSLDNLKVLTINRIRNEFSVMFVGDFNNLISLNIGMIFNDVKFWLPKCNNLKSLSIQAIGKNSFLKLPTALDSLTSLSIGYISSGAILQLPSSFKSLTNFTFGTVEDEHTRRQLISFREGLAKD